MLQRIKTIVERAYDYADEKWGDIDEYHTDTVAVSAYIAGAEEQKQIDIEKACEWLKENTEGGVHPQRAYSFPDIFRKAMEE